MTHQLYREILIDHYRNPRHSQLLESPTHAADTANRSCGDRVQVTLLVENSKITNVGILTEGCSLAVAGGSVLAERIIGKSLEDSQTLNEREIFTLLGGIEPSASRARCASLALEALRQVIESRS